MNYMNIVGREFPGCEVSCIGDTDNYDDLVWVGGVPMPTKAEMEAVELVYVRDEKIRELSDICQVKISAGFVSSALGSPHMYDGGELDQLNLIGAVTSTSPTPDKPAGYETFYAVRKVVNDVVQPKTYVNHTHFQLRKVIADGSLFKLGNLQRFDQRRQYLLNNVLSFEQIAAVEW